MFSGYRWAASFSPDYATARARFRAGAEGRGCELRARPIEPTGPYGEELALDVAHFGSAAPRRAVVVTSGTHGVEGFFGSAVQATFLEQRMADIELPADGAVLLVHAVNPYGFAHIRRVNEDNVDLNRNFLREGEAYSGAPAGYAALDGMLNPPSPPPRLEAFGLKFARKIVRHGLPAMKATVAGGQYEFDKGLFFGGRGPSRSKELLGDELRGVLRAAERVLHIDFHTGLGANGRYKLFVDHPTDSAQARALGDEFGAGVEAWERDRTSFEIRGGLGTWCKSLLPACDYDVLAAEFGTYNVYRVIRALRAENRAHFFGAPDDASTRRAKADLLEVFAPADPAWRHGTVTQGMTLIDAALKAAFA
jgi:hypothetical protein